MLFKNGIEISENMPQASVWYYKHFLDNNLANTYYNTLLTAIPWQQDTITVFGKTYLQPRLTALFCTTNKTYSYSNIIMHPNPFNKELLFLKQKVEALCGITFNSCLANFYRDGTDSNGWHSDDEKELGINPFIASLSLGAERVFKLKHKHQNLTKNLTLGHGSLLIMKDETQHFWKHQLPKTQKKIGGRINLTFRVLK